MLQEFVHEPTSQLAIEPGVIDLSWGHVDPQLLPAVALQSAALAALARPGAIALGYGHERGSAMLRAWLAERITRHEGRAPRPAELMLTGGTSSAIDQVCTLLTQPGDVVLVESPTYHLAVRILRDHPLELWPVPRDAAGIDPAVVAHLLHRAAASGRRAHHRCSVLGWPWRIDFSRAEATLIASSGNATSMSFFLGVMRALLRGRATRRSGN